MPIAVDFAGAVVLHRDPAVEEDLDLAAVRLEGNARTVQSCCRKVCVQRDLALIQAAVPTVSREIIPELPARGVALAAVGSCFGAVRVVEGNAFLIREEVDPVSLHRLLQTLCVRSGIGGLGPQHLRTAEGGSRDVPSEVAAAAVLRALHAEGDGVQGEVEEEHRNVDADRHVPLEAGDVEALVAVGILKIAAHRHGDGNAGLEEDVGGQRLHEKRRQRYASLRCAKPLSYVRNVSCFSAVC